MVRAYLNHAYPKGPAPYENAALQTLITRIAAISGNPRGACWRFVRRLGIAPKSRARTWTPPEQQKLMDLIASHSLAEVAVLLRRSPASVRSMLHRLGASARMGQDWFTKHALARALHIRTDEVQKWIDRGWLKCRNIESSGLRRQLIDAADFCDFCRKYRKQVVGNRLNFDRLNFVQTFVFPPSHTELLPVRSAKKEQEAYEEQRKKEIDQEQDDDNELGAIA